ncbi:hypothetical protein [Deinococcus sonorensis]|uniref:DUF1400 domain-containing protein n=2 Tax=Deinococcus sonorensis TaxID=309891 RepID=A0AAU7UCA4_9DEIO
MSKSTLFRLTALTVTTALVSAPSFAVQKSSVTGLQVLVALGNARGVPLSASTQSAILRTPSAFLQSKAAATLAKQLRISTDVLAQLVKNAGVPVSSLLATQAGVQSATGEQVLVGSVQTLIAKNKNLEAVSVPTLAQLITNPDLLNQINSIANGATQPVTPVGGNK